MDTEALIVLMGGGFVSIVTWVYIDDRNRRDKQIESLTEAQKEQRREILEEVARAEERAKEYAELALKARFGA